MTPTKLAARAILAGITLSALGLFVAAPASAHTNNLYSYVYDEATDTAGWGTLDRTNGDAALLPVVAENDEIQGTEVFGEAGYAIGEGDEEDDYYGATWDHSTGAQAPSVPLFITDAVGISYVGGLDTRNDGTPVTYVEYSIFEGGDEFPTNHAAIATVNFVTGELVPVVLLDDLIFDDAETWEFISLATDPLSGITYGFLEDASLSFFLPLDVPSGTYGVPAQFQGAGFESGFFNGADFDGDGTLFFIYGNNSEERYELSHVGVVSTWPTAAREFIGEAAGNLGGLETLALTVEYVAPPALAATGTGMPVAWLIAGGVAVLAGGIVVVTSRRRGATA